jgi:diguanylate cyclase (GGDEF)-like protein
VANPELSSVRSDLSLRPSLVNRELTKQTLMIVDDYQSNLKAMVGLFEFHYDVVLKDNAKDAINYAIQEEVDLILLDVDMPQMDGYEACAALKSNPMTAHIPIIFVTAASSVDEEEKGLLLGAVDYVVKPVNLSILRARVKNHMELIYYRKKLEILSSIDGLTGVSNRRQLDTMLLQHYASTIRFGHSLAFLMIDIDDFKAYNDTYGHAKGDECLKQVAQTILSVMRRETDVVGRYGGEEFGVSLQDTDFDGGEVVAKEILSRVRNLNIEHLGSLAHKIVTVSIGLAVFEAKHDNHQEITLDEFIQQADEQLYKAKHNGKNRFSHATGKIAVTQNHRQIEI